MIVHGCHRQHRGLAMTPARVACRGAARYSRVLRQALTGEARHLASGPWLLEGDAAHAALSACSPAHRGAWSTVLPAAHGLLQRGLRTSAPVAADVTVEVPSMGDSVSEGTIAAIEKKPGDAVAEDDLLVQIETDKVTIDVRYQQKEPGIVKEFLVKMDDTVQVGQPVAVVDQGAEAAPAAEAPADDKPAEEKPRAEAKNVPAAEQKGDKPDAPPPPPPPKPKPKPEPAKAAQPSKAEAAAAPVPPVPSSGKRPERRVKMTRLRARVAERLKGAQNTYAMLTTFNEIDMTNLMQLRADFKDLFLDTHGVKLGFMSAFVKAASDALQKVPAVNAVIDGDEIVYRDYTDISIAVATPKGLVVPVLRSADELSFADVEKTINALGKKARAGTLSIDEMAGGTFTISNGGVYGSLLSTPIINPPQSAILGMHSINPRAAVVGKEQAIMPRPIMNVALTYDHRLIDGREGVTFLKRVKEIVEDPRRLLLDV